MRLMTTELQKWFSSVLRCFMLRRFIYWKMWGNQFHFNKEISFFFLSFYVYHQKQNRKQISRASTTPFTICPNRFKSRSSDTTWESSRASWRRMHGRSWIDPSLLKESMRWLRNVRSGADESLAHRQVALMSWIMAIFSSEICSFVKLMEKFVMCNL